MSENKWLLGQEANVNQEDALSVEIISAIHSFTRFNIGSILGEISQMEFLTLYLINNKGKLVEPDTRCMYVSEIANILNVSTPAVSRLIKSLEEKSLAERVTDKNDRRNTYVCLTETGKSVLENDEKIVREFSMRVTDRIGRGKLMRLLALAAELGGAVQEELAHCVRK